MKIRPVVACLCILSIGILAASRHPPNETNAPPCLDADLIVRNGQIFTMNSQQPWATSMAIRDGKILAVGSDGQIAACASPRTHTIDLAHRTVIPGLIDIHTHSMEWAKGILRDQLDVTAEHVHAIADIVAMVRQRAAKSAKGAWISGAGWDDAKLKEHRYITRQDLDPVSPANPVYLDHVSGHLGVTNSAGLALAGITRNTPDPPGGVIEHDASGEPTGIVKDNAMDLVSKLLPPDPPDLSMRAAKLTSERALAVGLTTIHDIYISSEEIRGYQDAYERGWLKLRVQMSPRIGSIEDAEKLAQMGVHTSFGNNHLKFGAAKMFADGGMGARTIAIYPPSVIGEPDNFGVLRWAPADMQKAHMIAARAGWQLETHAIGDRAIDEVLDSYAAVIKALDLKDPRFRIVHAGISTPAIQKRLKELNVLVDGNPPFVYWIGSWFKKYGPERVRWSYPAKSYMENGIVEGAGSDVPVTPKILAPEERLSVPEAIKLYTINGAYVGFEEKEKGSLEAGKLADFIILDRDIFSVPTEEIKDTKVLETYLGGELVFQTSQQAQATQTTK